MQRLGQNEIAARCAGAEPLDHFIGDEGVGNAAPGQSRHMHAPTEWLRRLIITDLLKVGTVAACWPTWRSEIRNRIGDTPDAAALLGLGGQLGDVFRSTSTEGRGQGSLSGAGAAWEGLVCWYLNLCLVGTRAVVAKNKSHVPNAVRSSLNVNYGATQTNTEADLVGMTLVDRGHNQRWEPSSKPAVGMLGLEVDVDETIDQTEVCVIQCKTNWNDNSQIPMLWDMVYAARDFGSRNIHVGSGGYGVHRLGRFAYAFVTVPSNQKTTYKRTSMSVLRVAALSGGNYWGRPSESGVASSVDVLVDRNFRTATENVEFDGPWRVHLSKQLAELSGRYDYFGL